MQIKGAFRLFAVAAAFAAPTVVARKNGALASGDRTITRVVKLLQGMLDQSKADDEEERTLYGKYKCYCDQNEASKKESIESLTQQIGMLESEIDGLQASSGILSQEVAKLKADMADNEESRSKAQSVRDSENADWVALEKDYTAAIAQMGLAIDTLSEIGADQTLGESAADHDQFMKGNSASLTSLRKTVKQALVAASAFVTKKQSKRLDSFLQTPFTGTYTAQSGEVVGILKDMKDTFTSNLDSARVAEEAAVAAHTKYMKTMLEAYATMEASYDSKQGALGDNDMELADKKTQLETAETQKASDEEFLAELLEICAGKAKDYEQRNLLRKNEDAAIAEAISILNTDAAFETFGTVSATSTGETGAASFLQIKQHVASDSADDVQREKAQKLLRQAAAGHESRLLSKAMALLQAGNPFAIVVTEIKKMLSLIEEEDKADTDKLNWCDGERTENNANLAQRNSEITELDSTITTLQDTIENPTTGLKFQISETETSLTENSESQTTQTKDRKEASALYQADIKQLTDAERLLNQAVSVLEKYYAKILKSESAAMLQARKKRQPTPPETWENDSFQGQSGKGNDAISMIQFILEETKKEESVAHTNENDAQHAFEDSMTTLKTEEASLQSNLATLTKTLADTEQELMEKKQDLEDTIKAKEAIEAYLLKIKPGCDFITSEISLRQTNRAAETAALNQATELLTKSPAYMTAEAVAHNDTLGDCLGVCANAGEEHVTCKACLAKVTVPGYCAGHAGTEGC